jgi:nicotinamidase-related amidase
MSLNEIDVQTTAILFFDLLNGYYHGAEDAIKARMKPMVDNAVRLMKAGRQAGIPIIFAKGNHRPDGLTGSAIITDTDYSLKPWPGRMPPRAKPRVVEGEWSSEVIPELEPRPEDYYIPKHRWSAFYQTYLDLALSSRGIDTVFVSGGSTDVGVAATVFAGRDLDYNLVVARDACSSSHDQRAHDTLMDLIFPRMCRVRSTEQVLAMIRKASNGT